MCFCATKEENKIKLGTLYEKIRPQLRPFDPIFFRGSDFISKTIMKIEKIGNRIERSGDFSHVGMIVTSDILDDSRLIPGKKYIWESTMSGKLGGGNNNINGKSYLGVQLRDFDELIVLYDAPNNTSIAVGTLFEHPLDKYPADIMKNIFTPFFKKYDGRRYDANLFSLLSAICPGLRFMRKKIEKICHTEDWLFCSELLAMTYIHLNIYPSTLNPKNVVPRDIVCPEADTDRTPRIIMNNVIYMTTRQHYVHAISNQQRQLLI